MEVLKAGSSSVLMSYSLVSYLLKSNKPDSALVLGSSISAFSLRVRWGTKYEYQTDVGRSTCFLMQSSRVMISVRIHMRNVMPLVRRSVTAVSSNWRALGSVSFDSMIARN